MQVSAISVSENYSNIIGFTPFAFNKGENYADTSFNSLSPRCEYDKLEKMFNNICEWQNFCHARIMENHLDIIA